MPAHAASESPGAHPPTASTNGRLKKSQQVLSPQDLGRANRFRVLQALVDRGPLSRAELSRLLGVPRASVGAITNALVESGVLQEDTATDQPRQGRGKPPRPLWFAESAGLTGAVTIESNRVSVGVVNARGTVLEQRSTPITVGISPASLLHTTSKLVSEVVMPRAADLVATGVSVPAQVDSVMGEIELCTIIPSLTGSPLVAHLEKLTGGRVWLNQDVRALAAAERWFGKGRGSDSFSVLEIDIGVGVGFVIEGHLFPGASVSSPQVGHTCVDRFGLTCTCGSRGCWETIASLTWLRREAEARGIANASGLVPADLVVAAEEGHRPSATLLSEFADNLAIGIANLAQVLRIPLVILQGAIADAGEGFAQQLAHAVARHITWGERVEIVTTPLRQSALLLGAGASALSHEFGIRL